ncbi:hypothetical protein F5B22DRAFT_641697 [Xylaria bambusicola]|uniref:uncharacterized protein n=1 Tax=Xylaria bambusicola TaxID=326684 RepID=UPI002008A1AD|nr:uncharacterized protein F5B22DRAFT_641697 [Xylaria bambusicola]KAI0526552.1 hypothetical protein F5B22DRAFT_641697 [Xylaria bambusicola]
MVRPDYPTRASLEKFLVSRQDSIGSDNTLDNKATENKESSRSESRHWFKRTRSSSEGHKPNTPTVNLYTHCGRHTNQYLFGGHSISESIKDIIRKK